MNNKDRIAYYLTQGLKPTQVASIVGVTPAYITQLLKDVKENPEDKGSEFKALLEKHTPKESEGFSEDKALTNKYLSIEHKLIDAIEGQLAFAELPALTRTLEVVANRQEKRAQRLSAPTGPSLIQNIVQLTIPAHAIPEHLISSNKEVIAIGSQQLAPLSADGVKNLFAQITLAKTNATTVEAIEESAGSEF